MKPQRKAPLGLMFLGFVILLTGFGLWVLAQAPTQSIQFDMFEKLTIWCFIFASIFMVAGSIWLVHEENKRLNSFKEEIEK